MFLIIVITIIIVNNFSVRIILKVSEILYIYIYIYEINACVIIMNRNIRLYILMTCKIILYLIINFKYFLSFYFKIILDFFFFFLRP